MIRIKSSHLLLAGMFLILSLGQATASPKAKQQINHITITGYLGERIDDCIAHRVKSQDVEHLIAPFREQNETHLWQSEFWGKWIQGAIASYRYNQDPELYKIISDAVDGLLSTQLDNGYIGNYAPEAQLEEWDVWGRKYTMLGLLAYYNLSGDKKALKGAERMFDHLVAQLDSTHQDITKTGNYRGMASSSILEPIMYLYNITHKERYLEFAKEIVSQWETPDGTQLVSKALAEVPVAQRFPHPAVWWSRENGKKAYEMMSCYEGLLELYKVTGTAEYLEAAEKTIKHIIAEEINIAGSGSAFECWYGGKEQQTRPTFHTMETCVTFTWMQICNRLLQITSNPIYADQIEKTAYNALMASFKGDGSQIAKYSPLEGCRVAGEEQCHMHINCCNANGPRAFAMLPQFAYQQKDGQIYVNLYAPSEAEINLSGNKSVSLIQQTDYPQEDVIEITVDPQKETQLDLLLRIPEWSLKNTIAINGIEETTPIRPGSYYPISRTWKKGDKVTLKLDLRAKLIKQNNAQAIVRGPIVLARDSRFKDGYIDEASVIVANDNYVELQPVKDKPSFAWMAFTAPLFLGTDKEGGTAPTQVHFCDFASAGNTWDTQERYRIWLPETLNVMTVPYTHY